MNLIYHVLTLLLLIINIAGLTVLVSRAIPAPAIARSAGILLFCLALFFFEHFVGLGKLTWLWPLTTSASLYFAYADRKRLEEGAFWRAELVFIVALGYALAWKLAFPEIYPTSERVTDLVFIGNYLPGSRLPPLDHWSPPNHFDFYYAFQHYAAALMGRIFGMSPGLTYNVAFALLMALPISLAWDFAARFLRRKWARWLVVVTFTLGGTGATPFVHLSYDVPADAAERDMVSVVSDGMWASQRFIGSFDQRLNTNFGRTLFPNKTTANWEARELQSEDFGYQFYVGDYHPPLGGFFLLLLAIAAIGAMEATGPTGRGDRNTVPGAGSDIFVCQALLALTVPVTIATNTWVFPLQSALVLGWVGWRYMNRCPPNWKALLIGGIGGLLLLYPFLAGIAGKATATPIRWVSLQDHTPPIQFLAQHWPELMFGAIAIWHRDTRRIALLFSVVFVGLLLISELIYVDDPSGEKYERANTTMKWWGWIWSGSVVTLGVALLASSKKWVRWLAVASLTVINLYAYDVARYWIYTGKDGFGKLEAHGVYTGDAAAKDIFRYLSNAPYGIVLENCYEDAYSDSGIYAAFAAKPNLLGWPSHLMTWHGNVAHVWAMKSDIVRFYAGTLPASADWLVGNRVDYIIWNHKDQEKNPKAWQSLHQAIADKYDWQEFQDNPEAHIGLWVRRP